MRIIKHGSKDYNNPEYLIHCKTCGCEFIVTRNEMAIAGQHYNELLYCYPCPNCENRCRIAEGDRRILH